MAKINAINLASVIVTRHLNYYKAIGITSSNIREKKIFPKVKEEGKRVR